ncbi:GNAT family N-acetyltransferase [Chamaesiphon sp.]|uniref:GNAT family N-acetyltransferase n=1 Tax=Chamaesiphon sp. TaxID=2814140 RepID=UPI003593D0D1
MIECRQMTIELREDAFSLLRSFLCEDEYYLDSGATYGAGGETALNKALELFLQRPEFGFVWLAYDEGAPAGVCIVCLAISTAIGGMVAKLDDVFVISSKQGRGVGSALLQELKQELRDRGVLRIDTSVHLQNDRAQRFYRQQGFQQLNEEKLACVL